MNKALGRTVTEAMGHGRGRTTIKALATRTGLGESWIKQVRQGNIEKPPADKLRLLADALHLDYGRLLAMTDQLGASVESGEAPDSGVRGLSDLVARLDRYATLVEALVRQNASLMEAAGIIQLGGDPEDVAAIRDEEGQPGESTSRSQSADRSVTSGPRLSAVQQGG